MNVVDDEEGRCMACGVVEVKRVKASDGGRAILGAKIFMATTGFEETSVFNRWCHRHMGRTEAVSCSLHNLFPKQGLSRRRMRAADAD